MYGVVLQRLSLGITCPKSDDQWDRTFDREQLEGQFEALPAQCTSAGSVVHCVIIQMTSTVNS